MKKMPLWMKERRHHQRQEFNKFWIRLERGASVVINMDFFVLVKSA